MTKKQMIEAIKDACGRALGYDDPTFIQDSDYTLSHVLLAIRHAPNGIASCRGSDGDLLIVRPSIGHEFIWNLRADHLTQQSDETIRFLFSLLK